MTTKNRDNNEDTVNDLKNKLEKLECPFTWGMNSILIHLREAKDEQYSEEEEGEFYTVSRLMKKIMFAYVSLQTEVNEDKVLEELKKCDKDMKDLVKCTEMSLQVVEYILQATQCFVFQKFGMINEMNEMLQKVMAVRFAGKKDISTMNACKAVCWSMYYEVGAINAEKFIRAAIAESPDCALYHFILGKIMRTNRRLLFVTNKLSDGEAESFKKAYELSHNPLYGINVARLYRELKDYKKATELYEKIFNMQPNNTYVLLQLALGFIRNRDFDRARTCLEKIKQNGFQNHMYYHYFT